ncbi:kelch repeat-containing protein [Ulvibacter antarcticus]|uniref:Putative secreted protein (Por secretion system target) n=1 Tax=Ulvibacter antarcticus TaxID=442714 RepID=A0A3L9YE65_9FLAO|nr:kelch repeat-containing protein [Ulvibacter antarcticus]RMA56258.1 putative secreted protein (Por secretion system target) [Ulvibacter antarcticus]
MKKLLFLLVFILLTFPNIHAQWNSGADIPERIRAGQTIGYSKDGDGYLFMVSGRNQDGIITPITQRYQVSTNTWTNVAPPPTQLLGGSIAVLKDTIYTIGGLLTTPGNAIKTVRKYNIATNSWSLAADFPRAIVDARAVAYQDSLIYVVGGYQHKTYLYNSNYNRWREATPMLPPGSSISWGGFAINGNKLVYMCGSDNFMSTNYWNTVWVGTIDANDRSIITWEEKTPFPGQTRTFFEAQTWRDGIIMTGGSTDNTFNTYSDETYFYNPDTDIWHQLASKPTSWVTGNSGSVFIGNTSKLICASGFQTDYLFETEIFSQEGTLSLQDYSEKHCGIEYFKILRGSVIKLNLCLTEDGPIQVIIRDEQGRVIKKIEPDVETGSNYSIAFDGLDIGNGMYFCTVLQNGRSKTKKMLVLN